MLTKQVKLFVSIFLFFVLSTCAICRAEQVGIKNVAYQIQQLPNAVAVANNEVIDYCQLSCQLVLERVVVFDEDCPGLLNSDKRSLRFNIPSPRLHVKIRVLRN
jgi:hypothetical protein